MSQESMLLKKCCGSPEVFPASKKRDNQHRGPIWAESGLRPMNIKNRFPMVSKTTSAGTSGDIRLALDKAGSWASMFVLCPTSPADQARMHTCLLSGQMGPQSLPVCLSVCVSKSVLRDKKLGCSLEQSILRSRGTAVFGLNAC